MLRYFAHGPRRLSARLQPNWRTNWEFYAVLDGRAAPVFTTDDQPPLREKTLWVFAPDCCHGWISRPDRAFTRLALHFGTVPAPLEAFVRARGGHATLPLAPDDLVFLGTIAAELAPHYAHPTNLSPLHAERRLLDLSLLLLRHGDTPLAPILPDLAASKVQQALAWFDRHVTRNPSVKEVADAIHVCPSHLRRLFWRVRQSSPKAAFAKIRLDHARDLMGRTALTLDEIARRAGFASPSHLCREFKAHHGYTPTVWRKKIVLKFLNPAAAIPDETWRESDYPPVPRAASA